VSGSQRQDVVAECKLKAPCFDLVFLLAAFHCIALICYYCFFIVVNKISIYPHMVCAAGSYVTVLYGVHPSVPCARCFFLQHMPSPYHSSLFCCSTSTKIMSSIPDLPRLITWKSVFYLNARHPSDYSHLCSLKCHLIFFPYRPGLTYVPIKLMCLSARDILIVNIKTVCWENHYIKHPARWTHTNYGLIKTKPQSNAVPG